MTSAVTRNNTPGPLSQTRVHPLQLAVGLVVVSALFSCQRRAGKLEAESSASANLAATPASPVASVPITTSAASTASAPSLNPVAPGASALPESREHCHHAPLSPSTTELPKLGALTHQLVWDHGLERTHVFTASEPRKSPRPDFEAWAGELRARSGVALEGIRACPTDVEGRVTGKRQYCGVLKLPVCQPWLPMAERLAPLLEAEGLGLVVEIEGRVGPRCRGENCIPLAYHTPQPKRDDLTWSGLFTLPYRAAVARVELEPELRRGRCEQDGDCVRTGCGNHCEAWFEEPHGARCPGFSSLTDAYCGCVASTCSWFTQTGHLGLKLVSLEVANWPTPAGLTPETARTQAETQVKALFNEWFTRQLERLAPDPRSALSVRFDLRLDTNFKVRSINAQLNGGPAPKWLRAIFEHLVLAVPEGKRSRQAVTLRGEFVTEPMK